jgi:hypothetical protein
MANVLKVLHPVLGVNNYWNVAKQNGWTLPAIGGFLYFRMYIRFDISGGAAGAMHTVQTAYIGGDCPYTSEWELIRTATALDFSVSTKGGSSASDGGPTSHEWTTSLARATTYRVEEQYERTGTNTWKLTIRIYDSSNTLIKQNSDFVCASHGENLGTYTTNGNTITSGTDCLRHKMIGQPDAGDRGSSDTSHQFVYYGGFAVSKQGWIGAYDVSNG